jgi:hypothetical protein
MSQYYATVHRRGAESVEAAQRKYQEAFLLFLSAESPRSAASLRGMMLKCFVKELLTT